MKTLDFKPKIVSAIKNYNRQTLMADVMAGIIVGIVALPLAIAFGMVCRPRRVSSPPLLPVS